MSADIYSKEWLDLVFDAKHNKMYGAYDLRSHSRKTIVTAFFIGSVLFSYFVITMGFFEIKPFSLYEARSFIVTKAKIPPKTPPIERKEIPEKQVEVQIKFVKPEAAKVEEVVEDPPKISQMIHKVTGSVVTTEDEEVKIVIVPPNEEKIVEEDTNLYNFNGIEVKPEFPGGLDKFYQFFKDNFKAPEVEGLNGQISVQFVVEKDGSISNVIPLIDIGHGTGAEAVRVFQKCPKWTPGIQNGQKVRCTFVQSIKIQTEVPE